ncbi:transcriptional regulator [Stenotrophomonas sp. PS02298]|uniref:helix-turn-helix domain-containing protein n=1 Tax=Stenotrophomonas sp. PS02298 TaxID=2991424 RepID=UPI00249C2876|nr:transcriptional regulator [Stenotrophomonas sp. PS02298]
MDIKPIKNEADYRAMLGEIDGLMMALPDTPEGDRLDVLVTLVQAYEAKHYALKAPNPIAAIKFRMEQSGLTVKDLVSSIGQPNRVYEVLNGKRELTLPMIRKLHRNLGIPVESLVAACPPSQASLSAASVGQRPALPVS